MNASALFAFGDIVLISFIYYKRMIVCSFRLFYLPLPRKNTRYDD